MEANKMAIFIAQNLEEIHDNQGLLEAQEAYRQLFVTSLRFAAFKAAVDAILTLDGYGEIIVTE
jgi:hypothetical protein